MEETKNLPKDKLDLLFQKQYDLQVQGMHYDFDNMTTEQRAAYVKEYVLHCEHELHEAIQEMPFFKPWKRYDKDAESEKNAVMWAMSRKEFVDALHFFLCVAIGLGFTPDELFEMYCDKNAVNYDRQKDQATYKPSADEA